MSLIRKSHDRSSEERPLELFKPGNRNKSARHKRIYAMYELWYTIVDFIAATSFLVGSFLFFSESTQTAATWLFVVGSVFFFLKPALRLARELRYLGLGDVDTLAERAGADLRDERG